MFETVPQKKGEIDTEREGEIVTKRKAQPGHSHEPGTQEPESSSATVPRSFSKELDREWSGIETKQHHTGYRHCLWEFYLIPYKAGPNSVYNCQRMKENLQLTKE